MYVLCFVCRVELGRLGGFGPSSTLCAGPSFSKHFGGKSLVAAARRVVMDTLRWAQFDLWPHPPF